MWLKEKIRGPPHRLNDEEDAEQETAATIINRGGLTTSFSATMQRNGRKNIIATLPPSALKKSTWQKPSSLSPSSPRSSTKVLSNSKNKVEDTNEDDDDELDSFFLNHMMMSSSDDHVDDTAIERIHHQEQVAIAVDPLRPQQQRRVRFARHHHNHFIYTSSSSEEHYSLTSSKNETPALCLAFGALMEGASSCHILEGWSNFLAIMTEDDDDDDGDDEGSTSTDGLRLLTETASSTTADDDDDNDSIPSVSRQSTDPRDNTTTAIIAAARKNKNAMATIADQNRFGWWKNHHRHRHQGQTEQEETRDEEEETEVTAAESLREDDIREDPFEIRNEGGARELPSPLPLSSKGGIRDFVPTPVHRGRRAAPAASCNNKKRNPVKRFLGNANEFVETLGDFLIGEESRNSSSSSSNDTEETEAQSVQSSASGISKIVADAQEALPAPGVGTNLTSIRMLLEDFRESTKEQQEKFLMTSSQTSEKRQMTVDELPSFDSTSDEEYEQDDDETNSTDEGMQACDNEELLVAIADLVGSVVDPYPSKQKRHSGFEWLRGKSCRNPKELLRNDDLGFADDDCSFFDQMIGEAQRKQADGPDSSTDSVNNIELPEPEEGESTESKPVETRSSRARRTVNKWIKRSLKTLKASDRKEKSSEGSFLHGNPDIEISEVPILLYSLGNNDKACDATNSMIGSKDFDLAEKDASKHDATRVVAVEAESKTQSHSQQSESIVNEENDLLGIETILGLYDLPLIEEKQNKKDKKRLWKLLSRGISKRDRNDNNGKEANEHKLANSSMSSRSQLSSMGILSVDSINTNILDRYFAMETGELVSKESNLYQSLYEVPSHSMARNRSSGSDAVASASLHPSSLPAVTSAPSHVSSLRSEASQSSNSFVSISDLHLDILAEALGDCVYVHRRANGSEEEQEDCSNTNDTSWQENALASMDNDNSAHLRSISLRQLIANLDIANKTQLLKNLTQKLRRSQLKRLAIQLALSYKKAQDATKSKGSKKSTVLKEMLRRKMTSKVSPTAYPTTTTKYARKKSSLRPKSPSKSSRRQHCTSLIPIGTTSLATVAETE